MTQELSTVTHVILFFDGSKKFLTTKMAQLILANSLSEADGFQLPSNAGYIRFSAIQKILLLGEYYQQYPDQRPVQLKKFESAPKPFWEHAKSGKAWEQIKAVAGIPDDDKQKIMFYDWVIGGFRLRD